MLVRDTVLSSSAGFFEVVMLWTLTLCCVAMVDEERLSSMDMFDRADLRISSSMRGVGERLLSTGLGFFRGDLWTCFFWILLLRWLWLSWSVWAVYWSVLYAAGSPLGAACESPNWLVKGLNSSEMSVIESFSANSRLAFVMLYLRLWVTGDLDARGDFLPSRGRCAP